MHIHLEVILAVGYVVFLLLLALGIELFAWSSHRGIQRAKTVGFQYHPHRSAWQCTEGNFLPLVAFDKENHVARYRATAHVCNKCCIKQGCTGSDEGRELAYPLGRWTATELGRFYHAFALTLLVLAGVFLAIELVRHPHPKETWILGACLFVDVGMVRRTLGKIREPRMQYFDESSSLPSASESALIGRTSRPAPIRGETAAR